MSNDGTRHHGGRWKIEGVQNSVWSNNKMEFYESSSMFSTYLQNGIPNLNI